MTTLKPAVEKLPLAARKNVRDGWLNKQPDLEKQLKNLLDEEWKFDINPLAIFPYAEVDSYGYRCLGDCIYAYGEAFIYSLNSFLSTHGPEGKTELNLVVPTHTITLSASTSSSINYCGTEISNGTLNLLFRPDRLATNINDVSSNLLDAISSAPQAPDSNSLSFKGRESVKSDYDAKILPLLEKCRALTGMPDLKFVVDFQEIGKMLKNGLEKKKDVRDDWERNLGDWATRYLEGFVNTLEREGFEGDELLKEGFEEGVPDGVVGVKVVDKLGGGKGVGSGGEVVLEGGGVWLQTTPERWGTNISYAAEKLVDIL